MALRAARSTRLRSFARGSRGALALAALLCTLAALAATSPALRHAHTDFLAGGEPGHGEAGPGDHLQSAYRLWLPGHQLEEGRSPWRDPYSFRPVVGPQLNPAAWPFGLPFWPLWRVLGIVVGWNLFVLLGLVAAGLFTYAWLRELGLRVGAAIVGGVAFEIAPYRLEQTAAGHLLAPISALLPLALWTFERGRRGSRWWLLPSVLAIASIPASGQVHLALGAVPFYLAYVLVRSRAVWPLVGAAASVLLAAGTAVLVWIFTIDGSIGEGGRSLRQVDRFSAEWLDFVTRHDRHGSESFVFLGWLTAIAAVAGLVLLVRRKSYGLAGVLGAASVVPVVLALGTNTPVYEAVRFAVWPLRYPRVPERLMPVACLAIAALAAYAVDWLSEAELPRRIPRQATVVAGVALVLLLADLRVTTFEATAADQGSRAYAALPEEGRVLDVPVFRPGIHYGGAYQYYGTQAPRERPQGYSTLAPRTADAVAKQLAPINCGDWTERPGRLLERLGVTSVMFHEGLFRDNPEAPDTAAFAWDALVRHGYRPRATDGPVTLLTRRGAGPPPPARVDEPPRDVAQFCDGWLPNDGEGRVTSAPHASVWAYNEGDADIRLFLRRDGKPGTVRITVDGRRGRTTEVAGLEETRVRLGDEGWHLVTFDGPPGVRVVAYALS